MREIKFRAWDKTNGEYYMEGDTFDLNYSGGYGDFYFDNDHPCNMRDVELVWEQYTGLKDKNRKEIYEGDILKWDRSKKPSIVEWCVAGFTMRVDTPKGIRNYSMLNNYDCIEDDRILDSHEIIGTIHDKEQQ